MKPRQIAIRVLQKLGTSPEFLETVMEQELSTHPIEPVDRRLIQELVYGVVRWKKTLDWLIDRKTARPIQNSLLRWLLRIGLYQMFWLDKVPDYAAVNESVEMAKNSGLAGQAGLINALLRGYGREMAATCQLLTELKERNPALAFSHPEFLCQKWRAKWGQASLRALLEWNNRPPPVYGRVNSLRSTATDLRQQWAKEKVDYVEFNKDWYEPEMVFELRNYGSLSQLPSFQQGGFYVQDPSTLLAVSLLELESGQAVLDLCAAPGGKTSLIAHHLKNQGRILAIEPQAERLNRLRENCQRLGVSCVEFAPELNAKTTASFSSLFDRILIDAPCSNTGAMRRRVELRWRIEAEELERLQRVQLELLRQAVRWLKPGGILVYSTCSLESEENQDVRRIFESEQPQLDLEAERQLLPFVDGVDGGYVARFRRLPAEASAETVTGR